MARRYPGGGQFGTARGPRRGSRASTPTSHRGFGGRQSFASDPDARRRAGREADSRDRLIIDSVVEAELKLAKDLLAYVHDAPEAVRKTQLQFHADFAPATGADSFEAALSALETLNGSMERAVKAEAAKHGSGDVSEAMASLEQELIGAGKRIAWIQRSAGDL